MDFFKEIYLLVLINSAKGIYLFLMSEIKYFLFCVVVGLFDKTKEKTMNEIKKKIGALSNDVKCQIICHLSKSNVK